MSQRKWSVDPTHSSIGFVVRHMMFAKVRGRFAKWNVDVELDHKDFTRTHVRADIEASSIDTGVADRDAHLRSGDFLEADKYPTLKFESSSVEKAGEGYRMSGKLTIRDVTRPVTLEVEELGRGKDPWGKQRLGFAVRGFVNRKEFGLTWNQALEAGGVLVGDKVEFDIELEVVGDSE